MVARGRCGRGARCADRRGRGSRRGHRRDRGLSPVRGDPPPAARRRAAAAGAAQRLALAARPLSVHPRPARPSRRVPATDAAGCARDLVDAGDRDLRADRAGRAAAGERRLGPLPRHLCDAGRRARPVRLCGCTAGGEDRPRAWPCLYGHALRRARADHGSQPAGDGAGALYRHQRRLAAARASPADADRRRRHRRRAERCRSGPVRVVVPARWRLADGCVRADDHQPRDQPVHQRQPVYALRRLLPARRLAARAQPGAPRLRAGALAAARGAVRPARARARSTVGRAAADADRLCRARLRVSDVAVRRHRAVRLSRVLQGARPCPFRRGGCRVPRPPIDRRRPSLGRTLARDPRQPPRAPHRTDRGRGADRLLPAARPLGVAAGRTRADGRCAAGDGRPGSGDRRADPQRRHRRRGDSRCCACARPSWR